MHAVNRLLFWPLLIAATAVAVEAPKPPAASPSVVAETPKPTASSGPVVGEVKVVGGATINAETVDYYLGVAAGDAWDAEEVAKNFQHFWDSGLVEELKVETEEMEPGKLRLVVTLRERPKVSEWLFVGNKKLSNSTLKEKLDTAGISIRRNVPLRLSEVQRLRQGLLEVYAKEGYATAEIEPVIEDAGVNLKKVSFKIDEGVKIKISEISFEGNELYGDTSLRRALKKVKQRSLLRPFGKKLIWSKESWGEDSENIKKFYMNRGYKDVVVGEPRVELIARNPGGKTQKERAYRMVIHVPLQEGRRFRMGKLTLKGATIFKEAPLLKFYEVSPGKTYNYGKIEQGNEAIKTLYQSQGYIYSYTNQVLVERQGEADVVDVVVSVYEGDRFRLGRLEFAGNTKTKDKVLRREFRLLEGGYMDLTTLKRSVFKVNQLGYFKLKDEPLDFKFDEPNKLVNVTVKGEEVGRTDIQFGAGYSELDKLFAQFSFSTRNFLGRGENLGVQGTIGRQGNLYSLNFSEPYFLDRRMLIGGSIYRQKTDLNDLTTVQAYLREVKGGSIVWGISVGDFGQYSTVYALEDTYARYSTNRGFLAGEGPATPYRPPFPTPYKDMPNDSLFYQVYSGVTSSITPAYSYDTKDDPFDPSQGLSYFVRTRMAGGPLGGDFYYLRPELGATWFHPLTRRYIFAANFEAGLIHPYGGRLIPTYDRYRLGGERSLRAFPYWSVLPRKANGEYFRDVNGIEMGGDRYLQLNIEYQIKLGGPLKLIFWFDTGNTWHESQGWDLSLLRRSAGAELRIFLPIFQAPLRFIYGINLKPFTGVSGVADEKKSDFTFSIGTTF